MTVSPTANPSSTTAPPTAATLRFRHARPPAGTETRGQGAGGFGRGADRRRWQSPCRPPCRPLTGGSACPDQAGQAQERCVGIGMSSGGRAGGAGTDGGGGRGEEHT